MSIESVINIGHLEGGIKPEDQGVSHILQQQLLVLHVRQLAPIHDGLLGEGLEGEVFDFPEICFLLLCSGKGRNQKHMVEESMTSGIIRDYDPLFWVILCRPKNAM